MIWRCVFILMGLAVNTLTRPQLWVVCFMLLMFPDLVITCFLRINQSLLFLFEVFLDESGEFWASHPLGTVENINVYQVTSQCPGIHEGPRFPRVSGALGSLKGEKSHSNTGARFVGRDVPWKVFFGGMSNNKVGEEVWKQEWLFWKQGKSLLLQRSGVFRWPWYCKI